MLRAQAGPVDVDLDQRVAAMCVGLAVPQESARGHVARQDRRAVVAIELEPQCMVDLAGAMSTVWRMCSTPSVKHCSADTSPDLARVATNIDLARNCGSLPPLPGHGGTIDWAIRSVIGSAARSFPAAISRACRSGPCNALSIEVANLFQASFLTLATVLTRSDPPSQAAALIAVESQGAAAPAPAFARAQRLPLSSTL